MSKLRLIVENEYRTDVLSRSFWVSTLLMPVLMVAFFLFGMYMMDGKFNWNTSENFKISTNVENQALELKLIGMISGIALVFFLMLYGSQIFNKVKAEKCNRIYEILATCVDGRTLMLGKVIAVGLIGITQILIWIIMINVIIIGGSYLLDVSLLSFSLDWKQFLLAFLWDFSFFLGGYLFYGSLYAAIGAISDRNNENQEYVVVLTFILLASFYISDFVIDNGSSLFSTVCTFLPFTAPSVACVSAISGSMPLWESFLSLIVLYVFSFLSLSFTGKIYTTSMLLKGKHLSPSDFLSLLHTK